MITSGTVLELCYFEQIQNLLTSITSTLWVLELCYFEQIQNRGAKKDYTTVSFRVVLF